MPNLTIRVTDEERDRLKDEAALVGFTLTRYARMLLGLGEPRPAGAPRGNRNNPQGRPRKAP